MRVLLVEDEEHKIIDLTERILQAGVASPNLVSVSGVRDAVLQATGGSFDLVVLDMALPTFSQGTGGGVAQSVGGVEVLRALNAEGLSLKIIIVTQYPGVIIGGKNVALRQVGKVASAKYGQQVLGAVLYKFKMPEWQEAFDALMERAK
jgi:CheY-like chemotaxis protein